MIGGRLARYGQNDAYERGWREGWAAALAKVQERGLEAVLAREKQLEAPVPMTLAFEARRGAVSGPVDEQPGRG